MSIEKVKEYFKSYGMDNKIKEFSVSSATVELVAKAVGTQHDICHYIKFLMYISKSIFPAGITLLLSNNDNILWLGGYNCKFNFSH